MRMTDSRWLIAFLVSILAACGKSGDSNNSGAAQKADTGGPIKMVEFVATQDGHPFTIDGKLFDTPEAKEFAATGKNPYIGKQDATDKGKKLYQMYSCSLCHGRDGQGQTGPSLHGPNFKYIKDATNKGMFETIWHGTNGGMGAKGKGLMDPTDPSNGLMPDEVLKIEAWVRTHSTLSGNE